jgi:hypothetical protein
MIRITLVLVNVICIGASVHTLNSWLDGALMQDGGRRNDCPVARLHAVEAEFLAALGIDPRLLVGVPHQILVCRCVARVARIVWILTHIIGVRGASACCLHDPMMQNRRRRNHGDVGNRLIL